MKKILNLGIIIVMFSPIIVLVSCDEQISTVTKFVPTNQKTENNSNNIKEPNNGLEGEKKPKNQNNYDNDLEVIQDNLVKFTNPAKNKIDDELIHKIMLKISKKQQLNSKYKHLIKIDENKLPKEYIFQLVSVTKLDTQAKETTIEENVTIPNFNISKNNFLHQQANNIFAAHFHSNEFVKKEKLYLYNFTKINESFYLEFNFAKEEKNNYLLPFYVTIKKKNHENLNLNNYLKPSGKPLTTRDIYTFVGSIGNEFLSQEDSISYKNKLTKYTFWINTGEKNENIF